MLSFGEVAETIGRELEYLTLDDEPFAPELRQEPTVEALTGMVERSERDASLRLATPCPR